MQGRRNGRRGKSPEKKMDCQSTNIKHYLIGQQHLCHAPKCTHRRFNTHNAKLGIEHRLVAHQWGEGTIRIDGTSKGK